MTTTGSAAPTACPTFRLLWVGEALASVSEQLFVVCLTLLVLDVADGAALGLVLAGAAVPRAVLLPFGGVLADRIDPARIVVTASWLRAAVLAVLATCVVLGPPPVVAVAALAGALGVLDAAYYPASLALLPRVVAPQGLATANALVQGAESAGDLLGPAAAVALVAVGGLGGAFGSLTGLYLAAAIVLTAVARLLRGRTSAAVVPAAGSAEGTPSSFRALRDGLRYVCHEPVVRAILMVLAVLNVAVVGPLLVGGAVLAEQRLGGAAALAVVFTGFGVGSLLGLAAAGARPPRRRGAVLLVGTALIGVGTVAFGLVGSTAHAVAAAAVVGIGEAYLGVVLVAWLQEAVPEQLRGRVMSLVVLAVVAFDPLSYALAGALLSFGTTTLLFSVCGGLVLLCAAAAACSCTVRTLR